MLIFWQKKIFKMVLKLFCWVICLVIVRFFLCYDVYKVGLNEYKFEEFNVSWSKVQKIVDERIIFYELFVMDDMRVGMCMVCGLYDYIIIDCLNRCGFCGDVIDIGECVNISQ